MIIAARDHLEEAGADEEKVHFVSLGPPPTTTGRSEQKQKHRKSQECDSKVKVVMDGDEFELKLDSNGPVLDAATEAGLDVPFSCKGLFAVPA